MQFLDHLRPRFILLSRVTMWAVIALLFVVGLFKSVPAWAEPAACPGNDTIPITPLVLFLTYAGPAETYQVSLCEEADADVNVTTTPAPTGKVTINPASFVLTGPDPQIVSVSVAPGHPADEPFTVTITHSSTSDDPDFDWGSLNVDRVTAYYSPPVAIDDNATTLHGQSIAIDVRANDTDRLGQGLTVPANAVFTPTSGTATRNANQTIQFTPVAGFSGVVTFTYPITDVIGNSDIGLVTVVVAPAGLQNYTVQEVDPEEGGEVLLSAEFGTVEVEIPSLEGVPAGSDVRCLVGEVESPAGDETTPPGEVGLYTDIALALQCYVDGVLVDSDMLSGPITVTISLPESLGSSLDGARIVVAVWDGTKWVTEGIVIEDVTETTSPGAPSNTVIRFSAPILGEFVVFAVRDLYISFVERQ